MRITSAQNPRIKEAARLRKAGERRSSGLIVVEGARELKLAVSCGFKVRELFVCSELAGADLPVEKGSIGAGCILEVSLPVFRKIACRENSVGYVALVEPAYATLARTKPGARPLIVAVEAVEKPGNLGAILRTADAAGADAVLVCDPRTDIYNPNVIRSSLGAVFSNKVITCASAEAIAWLKEKGIRIVAATPHADCSYHEADFKGPVAIALGTEADGLTDTWLKAADAKVRIPMGGKVDSLNVSASCAILLYEALRQRGFAFPGV